jgi:flagellar protein FliS
MNTYRSKGAAQYQSTKTTTDVESASPHRLVQMLMAGAVEKLELAKQYMKSGQIAAKCDHIAWAMNIITGLQMGLDTERGGEIAANLDNLYDYMERRLVEANASNDAAILDEVLGLLGEIKGAWDAMPENVRQMGRSDIDATAPLVAAGA